ncbi:unnamed protein product [Adineta steineri]|uniref:Uncharacterized protein n=1 Tax=Adineta steineri TaxID=433720 RepID=A0A815ESC8_9BILA|nr:unnamed protein product [Adineta steineri]CAF3921569.1 unnamed protein product [Adineta steineri]
MYAPPAAAANRRSGLAASGPLLAICCLGFILFLIAATIVLALIPVYLSTRGSTSSSTTPRYTLSGTPVGNAKRDYMGDKEGTLADPSNANIAAAMDSGLGLNSGSTVADGTASMASTTSRRRRRGFGLDRERRAGIIKLFFPFRFNKHHCDKCINKGFQESIKTFTIIVTIFFVGDSTPYRIKFTCVIFFDSSFNIPTTSTIANTAKVIG